jgi:hypothetical protein
MANLEEVVPYHRRGNPNWGKPDVPVPYLGLTQFEQLAKELELTPGEYRDSPELRNWCLRNANRRYVPEYLLRLWGIAVTGSIPSTEPRV